MPALLGAVLLWAALGTLGPRDAEARSQPELQPDIRLVMVEAKNCIYCRKWDADIGPAYPKSDEGRFAPLLRVGRSAPEVQSLDPIIYTPTFVVLRGTKEVGRITGYPGPIYFWEELYPILVAAGYPANAADRVP